MIQCVQYVNIMIFFFESINMHLFGRSDKWKECMDKGQSKLYGRTLKIEGFASA